MDGALDVDHVVASQRYSVDALGDLDLEYYVADVPERHFRAGKIELPHPAKALVIQFRDLEPVCLKSLAPFHQGFCVVEAQNLNVGDEKAGTLDRAGDFAESGNVAARKNVFVSPWRGTARAVETADRM